MRARPGGIVTRAARTEPRSLSLFARVLIISALQSHGHTLPREGWQRERSGAARHPARKRCGAEAASDNASC